MGDWEGPQESDLRKVNRHLSGKEKGRQDGISGTEMSLAKGKELQKDVIHLGKDKESGHGSS